MNKKNNKIINIITSITSIMLVVLTVSLIYALVKVNILKISYVVVFSIIFTLVDLLLIINLNKSKEKYKRYITTFISLIFIFIYFICITDIISTVKFVNNITKKQYEYQTYSVIVSEKSNYKKVKELDDKIIGFISTNKYLDETKTALSTKANISVTSKDYDDNANIIEALNNNEIQALVFENNYLEIIKENNVDIFTTLKVIYTFKIKVDKTDNTKTVETTKDPFIIYISGSDSRGSISDTARSDVNILVVVNPNTNKILLVSIPRDYYVNLHGITSTKDKLTHAGIYGIDMSKDTISDLLEVNINYYVKVGFNTLIKSVDLLGGVDITSDKAFTTKSNKNCKIIEGTQHLDGACALAFSRERYAYESGDRHRGENQEQVLTKLIEKFSNPSVLTKYSSILTALDGSFETNMSYDEITNLIKEESITFARWNIESISLDGTGSSEITYSMGNQKLYVMIPDENSVEEAKAKIAEYLQK